jgi:hypothetical protein
MMNAALGLSVPLTRYVLMAAGLAPSLLNSQPWQFRVDPDRIELHADPGRRLIATDPEDRELRLACGAALFNLRLALHAHGITPLASLDPQECGGALAVVRDGGTSAQGRADAELYRAIDRRHTNRQPFLDVRVPASDRRLLMRAALDEGAVLHAVTDRAGQYELSCIIGTADRQQRGDANCRAELTAWTGKRFRRRDGVRRASPGAASDPHDVWGYLDMGHGRVRGRRFVTEPFVAVLATRADTPADQVQAGQALQRVLLTATTLGLSASFLSQPIEVLECRQQLRRLLAGRLYPQAILRLGFSSPAAPTPRRDVADLVLARPLAVAH